MDIISEDAFNYMRKNFLTKEEQTLLNLVHNKYSKGKVNIKSLVINNNLETLKSLNVTLSRQLVSGIAKTAAQYGHLQILEWLLSQTGDDFPYGYGVFNKAVSTGQLHIMEWLLFLSLNKDQKSTGLMNWCLNPAIKHKQYECIKWIFSKVEEDPNLWMEIYNEDAFKEAARIDDLNLMKRLYKENVLRDIVVDPGIFEISAEHGSLETIKWLLSPNGIEGEDIYYYDEAAISQLIKRGDLELIKFMYNKDMESFLYNDALNDGIRTGNLEIVKFLYEIGGQYNMKSFNKAALTGNLELMKYLKSKGCPFSNNTFHYAAINGNMEVMKWLLLQSRGETTNRYLWNKFTFPGALINGNKDNIKWLIENGCPWDDKDFYYSCSAFGSINNKDERDSKLLEYVKWLYTYLLSKKKDDRKFGWDCETFHCYAYMDCIPVLRFLLNPRGKKEYELINGRDEEHACPWNSDTYIHVVKSNKLNIFRWLYEKGCPYDMTTINYVIHMQRYKFLHWILTNRIYDGDLRDYLTRCLERGHLKSILVVKTHIKLIDTDINYYIKEWIYKVNNPITVVGTLCWGINNLGWGIDLDVNNNFSSIIDWFTKY
ncbi:Ankyrin-repeat protein [Orpheovirus IHUMI-LCC2]|uniref:Ankyrin-repeat protein n=1 Tax=Orpheovirus IHUMI-LCC2 TaxID=2023057 RepID=A0A2I2L3B2_9VIRU|nr:Ankyrin-repeat protein [Orpheovirus IHUMI-LCC2]SNW62000.1 Ankyrin-repeat protein [Orpheovirus IHUMI-LCC2]